MSRRITCSLWVMALMLVGMTILATGFGALRLPVSLLWRDDNETLRQIWLTIRLPRVLLALVIGGALALSGCVMQGLFRNPLADPGLLGISSGAACAVALWVVLPVSLPALLMLYAPMLAAFVGALAATVVIFILSQQRDGSLSRLLLVGIAALQRLAGSRSGSSKRRNWLHRAGYPAFNADVARRRPSGRYPRFRAGGRVFITDCRHAGPHFSCAGGNAGRSVNQSARRPVVFMAYFSSARSAWLNISLLKGFTIAWRASR